MTMSETKHTPTPWKSFVNLRCATPLKGCYINACGENAARIADVLSQCGVGTQEECEANAAFIVRAVNSHDALVEALESLIRNSPCVPIFKVGGGVDTYSLRIPDDRMAAARAALAAAKA
jgi:hypothetical protein